MSFWSIAADFAGIAASTGVSLYSSSKANSAISSGNNQAANISSAQYQQSRDDLAPWRGVGQNALYAVSALNGIAVPGMSAAENQKIYDAASNNFKASPGYSFRLNEGINALDKSAASQGRLRSGAQDKAILRYGDGLASQEYGNYMNRLSSTAGIGQTATTQTASLGASNASTLSNLAVNNGNARASGYQNAAGAVNTGFQNALMVN